MEADFFKHLSFLIETTSAVRKLSGWKKTYRIPDRLSSDSETLVARSANEEIQADLDLFFSKLKSAFGFKRRELTASDAEDGRGTITTPHFTYSIQALLNPSQLDEVLWIRMIDAISSPQQIASTPFAEVFDNVFDTLQLAFPKPVSVEDFIDAVEAVEIPSLAIEYDRDATYCELVLKGNSSKVTLKPNALSIVHGRPIKTQQLLTSLESIRTLVEKHDVPIGLTAKEK